MRRKRIHVSSGTYCRALAQFDLRMMSQIDLTNDDSERVPAMVFGGFVLGLGIGFLSKGIDRLDALDGREVGHIFGEDDRDVFADHQCGELPVEVTLSGHARRDA